MTDSTSGEPVRQGLPTLMHWANVLSLIWTIMGAFGWFFSEGEAALLAVPGLREALWAGLISLGPLSLIALNAPRILALFPVSEKNKLKALSPQLTKIARSAVSDPSKHWVARRCQELSIPCPVINTDPKQYIQKYDSEWRVFVMQLAPIAESGDIQAARRLLHPSAPPADFAT